MKKILLYPLIAAFLLMFTVVSAETISVPVSVSINTASLSSESSKPTLSGNATSTVKLKIEISKEGSSKVLYKKSVKVTNGAWKTKISKKLSDGNYDIKISGSVKGAYVKELAIGVLFIGDDAGESVVSKSSSTLVVSPIALLSGGTTKAGATVPISYLQINNVGKEAVSLKGFWVKQNGTADARSVVGLSTVDGEGGSRGMSGGIKGQTPFKDGMGFAPTDAVLLPGQMKLFTIKAILSDDASLQSGKNLMIDVSSIETTGLSKGTFPIRGTTWMISK